LGKVDYEIAIDSGCYLFEKREVLEQKIVNLTKMETNYYQDGNFVKSYKIESWKQKNGVFYITYIESDVRNGNELITTQIIDINQNLSYYCWYWDGDVNKTVVVKESNIVMKFD
jgi:hypothetical protein